MKSKVAIGISTTGTIKTRTMFSIVQLIKRKPEINLVTWEGCLIHQNRENIAKAVMNSDCTHLLFIDSDMIFNFDALDKLLARDKDIIGAPYNLKIFPPTSTVKIIDDGGIDVSEELPDGTFECYAIGTGFMLIKTPVLKKLSHPWFGYEQDDQGNTIVGEDIWFCKKAREAGFKIYCDAGVKVKHLGDYEY